MPSRCLLSQRITESRAHALHLYADVTIIGRNLESPILSRIVVALLKSRVGNFSKPVAMQRKPLSRVPRGDCIAFTRGTIVSFHLATVAHGSSHRVFHKYASIASVILNTNLAAPRSKQRSFVKEEHCPYDVTPRIKSERCAL